jgi:hypothetical protein
MAETVLFCKDQHRIEERLHRLFRLNQRRKLLKTTKKKVESLGEQDQREGGV